MVARVWTGGKFIVRFRPEADTRLTGGDRVTKWWRCHDAQPVLSLSALVLAVTAFGSVAKAQTHRAAPAERTGTPLVLQPEDGEHRMRRPPPSSLSTLTAPFILKVDERNGGAKDFVIFTENIPVGQTISPPRHCAV